MAKKTNTVAVNVAVWDPAGAPINPRALAEFEKLAEKLAKQENLLYTVVRA